MNKAENSNMVQPESAVTNVSFLDEHPTAGDSREELLLGLQQGQKIINPKYFYDHRGSQLFDQITRLPPGAQHCTAARCSANGQLTHWAMADCAGACAGGSASRVTRQGLPLAAGRSG